MLYFSSNSISFGETSLIPATAAHVDMQSARTLAELAEELKAAGSPVQVVEARSSVRDRLRAEGVDAQLGAINRFTSVADVVESFQTSAPCQSAI